MRRILNRNLEAPPGFEPGMEVLQGHPRSFSRDHPDRRSGLNLHGLSAIRQAILGAHRVWRWLKLGSVGSSRAQFGHSSAPNTETEDRIPLPGVGCHAIEELLIEDERFPVE
jgi:hypothetical protein